MIVNGPDYQNNSVFKQIERYISFYRDLAQSVFLFVSIGTKAIGNIDSYMFSSMEGTLTSIQKVLQDGRINDAYALLRKYHDSVVINIYSNIYLKDHCSLDTTIVAAVDDWLHGKKKLPEFRIMSQYIRNSKTLEPISMLMFSDDHYKKLRERCNDHTHYNFYRHVLLNDNEVHLPYRLQALDQFAEDLKDILILHAGYMFFLNDNYMMSSDYVDCLECGITPEDDSQYWVATFIQTLFNDSISPRRPDIVQAIKAHSSMQLA